MIIVFEGPDGSGKSTLIENVATNLIKKNMKVEIVKFPNEDHFLGYTIRQILKGRQPMPPTNLFQSMYMLNFIDTNTHYINPTLKYEPDTIFLIDRIPTFSSFVYSKVMRFDFYKIVRQEVHDMQVQSNRILYPSFDIINKYYGKLDYHVDLLVMLNIPDKVIIDHSMERCKNNLNSREEIFDKKESVLTQISYYNYFFESFKAEPSNAFTEFIKLNKWDNKLSEKDNYNNLENEFMTILTDRLGGYNNGIMEKSAAKSNDTD